MSDAAPNILIVEVTAEDGRLAKVLCEKDRVNEAMERIAAMGVWIWGENGVGFQAMKPDDVAGIISRPPREDEGT